MRNERTNERTNEAMTAPKWVFDGMRAMQAERSVVSSRLDALDLAISNLRLVYGGNGHERTVVQPARRQKPERREKPRQVGEDSSEAAARRDVLLQAIGRSEVGLSMGELRKQTPKMDGKDRGNALQRLKTMGKIHRVGNAWVKTED